MAFVPVWIVRRWWQRPGPRWPSGRVVSGHYLDTGAGPVELDAPEAPALTKDAAWAKYQAHRGDCPQCQGAVWRCADGNRMWNDYIEASS